LLYRGARERQQLHIATTAHGRMCQLLLAEMASWDHKLNHEDVAVDPNVEQKFPGSDATFRVSGYHHRKKKRLRWWFPDGGAEHGAKKSKHL